jgi:hypothetical protein
MTQEKFKLPRSSYEELCKIINAYGGTSNPASLDDIYKSSGVGKTVISANNKFLLAVEIIEGGVKKSATEKGRKLALALIHDIPEDITKTWKIIVEGNDFLGKMVQAVRIRKGMEISSLEAHIAYSAGETKTPNVMTGARTVIDLLLTSGLVREDNDRIIPVEIALGEETITTAEKKSAPSTIKVPTTEVTTQPDVSLNIEVHIDAKPSELDGLGEKLNALIKTLSKGGSGEEKSDKSDEQKG